mgnify:CR=1 FL=1
MKTPQTYTYGVISIRMNSEDNPGHKMHGEEISHNYWGKIHRGEGSKPLDYNDGEAKELVALNEMTFKRDKNIKRIELKRTIELII